VKYAIVDGSGELLMLANDGANESFTAAELDRDTLAAADHLHLTGQQPGTAAALATAAGEAGTTRSFDPGRRVGDREFEAALHATDVLFVNAPEADALADSTDIDPWEPDDRVVAIKLGEEGATVRTPHGDVSHPGFDIDAVDTVGAGDAFAAGFLGAALRDPGSPVTGSPTTPRLSGAATRRQRLRRNRGRDGDCPCGTLVGPRPLDDGRVTRVGPADRDPGLKQPEPGPR